MTDHPRETLTLQPVPPPWERPRRPRAHRGPDGRLLSEGDRRWMKQLAERQGVHVDADPARPAKE